MPLPPYLMSNFPSVRPSLNLQFDSQPTPEDMTSHLASVGATFSRASIGTYTDANGLIQEASAGQARPNYSTAGVHEGLLIEESRVNLIKSSEDFSTTDWTFANSSVVKNQAIAPDGLAGADKFIANTVNTNHSVTSSTTTVSGALCFSVFAKADEYNFIRLRYDGSTVNGRAWFNLSNGTVGTVDSGVTASIEDYGDGWYRCIAVESGNTNTSVRVQIFPQSANNQTTFAGDGESGILIWGAQVEEGSFPTSYIPTIPTFSSRASTATYFDSSGVLQTQAIQTSPTGVGRIDHKYIDGQWVEAGLLLEGASTNKIEYSEDWTSGSWSATGGGSVTQSGTIAGINSWQITSNGAIWNGANSPGQLLTSGTDYAVSIFVKEGTSGKVSIRIRALTTGVETAVDYNFSTDTLSTTSELAGTVELLTREFIGSDSIRLTIVINASYSEGYYFRTTANSSTIGESVFATAIQVEEGSQSTSYIPTTTTEVTRSADVYTTATKTRSADVCYIDGTAFTDFYNQDAGTVFIDFTIDNLPPSGFVNLSQIGGGFFIEDDGQIGFRGGLTSTQFSAGNIKASYKYTNSQANFDIFVNGGNKTTATGSQLSPTSAHIAQSASNNKQINGGIKKFIYFPRALSDNELIKLTQ